MQDENNGVEESSLIIQEPSKLERLEANLTRARTFIRNLELNFTQTLRVNKEENEYIPQGDVYNNASAFHKSYLMMEKMFKIFVYKEGELPMFHGGPCKNIYTTEGRFIQQMEIDTKFRTYDPDKAHVYFLPFSITKMVQYLYVPDSHDCNAIKQVVVDYVTVITNKHQYWNRSLGADHFMLSCHDWGPMASSFVPDLYKNSIRVLCNANTSEGFDPSKDASLPEINLVTGELNNVIGGPPPYDRSILAFFAGKLHGHIRLILLEHWQNKDEDLQVYETLPKGVSYNEVMKKSKYCLCPSGFEVASPRVVEAIYAECVPVLISIDYIPPFSDVLNWDSFAVQVPVRDIPNLKKILMEIPEDRYLRMQKRLKHVQRHFILNTPPKRYDVFHMILHSVWLRRLNVQISDQ
ncbi:hypothetical protein AQUCO_00500101v1 [Aquilegia coerulea]|uniref:Exostosin GT47 domain-containing protein n=1 Tax=Aquilegia coerulea TaxID=218851 RepID=A0A2G5EQD7_AQUCA|nr:hypothetical protein AQUCO_00500101v1 [Aquilegia coerulea]